MAPTKPCGERRSSFEADEVLLSSKSLLRERMCGVSHVASSLLVAAIKNLSQATAFLHSFF
jgi:hypothetical protein